MNERNDRANLMAWGVEKPRPGHLTECRRAGLGNLDRYAIERRQYWRRELARWLVLAMIAAGLAVAALVYRFGPAVLGVK